MIDSSLGVEIFYLDNIQSLDRVKNRAQREFSNLNLGPNTDGLSKSKRDVDSFYSSAQKRTQDYNKQLVSLNKAQQQANRSVQQGTLVFDKFSERIGFSANRLAAYIIPATAFFQVFRTIDFATTGVRDLNQSLVNLGQIFDGNLVRAKQTSEAVLDIATAYGQSGREIQKVALVLAQSGFAENQKELVNITKAFAQATLTPTFGDIDNTVQGGIAFLNQFKLSTQELVPVLDSANELSKDFAVSAEDIFTAVERGGAAFSQFGGDFRDFQATVAALRQLTRLPSSTIGAGLNTIVLRTFRQENVSLLESLGVQTQNAATGQLNTFVDILKQTADVYRDLTGLQKADLIESLFGIRQGKLGVALLNDLSSANSVFIKTLQTTEGADGSVYRDSIRGLDSIDVQLQRVSSSFEETLGKISGDENLIEFIRSLSDGIVTLASVAETAAPAIVSLLKVGSVVGTGLLLKNTPSFLGSFAGLSGVGNFGNVRNAARSNSGGSFSRGSSRESVKLSSQAQDFTKGRIQSLESIRKDAFAEQQEVVRNLNQVKRTTAQADRILSKSSSPRPTFASSRLGVIQEASSLNGSQLPSPSKRNGIQNVAGANLQNKAAEEAFERANQRVKSVAEKSSSIALRNSSVADRASNLIISRGRLQNRIAGYERRVDNLADSFDPNFGKDLRKKLDFEAAQIRKIPGISKLEVGEKIKRNIPQDVLQGLPENSRRSISGGALPSANNLQKARDEFNRRRIVQANRTIITETKKVQRLSAEISELKNSSNLSTAENREQLRTARQDREQARTNVTSSRGVLQTAINEETNRRQQSKSQRFLRLQDAENAQKARLAKSVEESRKLQRFGNQNQKEINKFTRRINRGYQRQAFLQGEQLKEQRKNISIGRNLFTQRAAFDSDISTSRNSRFAERFAGINAARRRANIRGGFNSAVRSPASGLLAASAINFAINNDDVQNALFGQINEGDTSDQALRRRRRANATSGALTGASNFGLLGASLIGTGIGTLPGAALLGASVLAGGAIGGGTGLLSGNRQNNDALRIAISEAGTTSQAFELFDRLNPQGGSDFTKFGDLGRFQLDKLFGGEDQALKVFNERLNQRNIERRDSPEFDAVQNRFLRDNQDDLTRNVLGLDQINESSVKSALRSQITNNDFLTEDEKQNLIAPDSINELFDSIKQGFLGNIIDLQEQVVPALDVFFESVLGNISSRARNFENLVSEFQGRFDSASFVVGQSSFSGSFAGVEERSALNLRRRLSTGNLEGSFAEGLTPGSFDDLSRFNDSSLSKLINEVNATIARGDDDPGVAVESAISRILNPNSSLTPNALLTRVDGDLNVPTSLRKSLASILGSGQVNNLGDLRDAFPSSSAGIAGLDRSRIALLQRDGLFAQGRNSATNASVSAGLSRLDFNSSRAGFVRDSASRLGSLFGIDQDQRAIDRGLGIEGTQASLVFLDSAEQEVDSLTKTIAELQSKNVDTIDQQILLNQAEARRADAVVDLAKQENKLAQESADLSDAFQAAVNIYNKAINGIVGRGDLSSQEVNRAKVGFEQTRRSDIFDFAKANPDDLIGAFLNAGTATQDSLSRQANFLNGDAIGLLASGQTVDGVNADSFAEFFNILQGFDDGFGSRRDNIQRNSLNLGTARDNALNFNTGLGENRSQQDELILRQIKTQEDLAERLLNTVDAFTTSSEEIIKQTEITNVLSENLQTVATVVTELNKQLPDAVKSIVDSLAKGIQIGTEVTVSGLENVNVQDLILRKGVQEALSALKEKLDPGNPEERAVIDAVDALERILNAKLGVGN